jgi:hypothetical protein
MKTALPDTNSSNIEPLLEEIERYLSAVELFRAEGCEPRWADDWPFIGATLRAGSALLELMI